MLSDKEMYSRMARGWRGGRADGTVCGQGSTMNNTRVIRQWLPEIVKKYGIKSVCDAGAGDLRWISRVRWEVDYRAFDLIPRVDGVDAIDITTQRLPECDAILCRMVLNHLDDERTEMAVTLFRESGKYLLATHFDGDRPKRDSGFTRLDLTKWLGDPIESSPDGHETGCRLALWRL